MMVKGKAFLKTKGKHVHYSFYSKSLFKCDKDEPFGHFVYLFQLQASVTVCSTWSDGGCSCRGEIFTGLVFSPTSSCNSADTNGSCMTLLDFKDVLKYPVIYHSDVIYQEIETES